MKFLLTLNPKNSTKTLEADVRALEIEVVAAIEVDEEMDQAQALEDDPQEPGLAEAAEALEEVIAENLLAQ